MEGMRPRGIGGDFGNSEVKLVDGDDLTWDWWQLLRETGDLSQGDVVVSGTLSDGEVLGARYDTRTCAERHNWHTGLLLRRIEQLELRLATVEAELDRWRGEM